MTGEKTAWDSLDDYMDAIDKAVEEAQDKRELERLQEFERSCIEEGEPQ